MLVQRVKPDATPKSSTSPCPSSCLRRPPPKSLNAKLTPLIRRICASKLTLLQEKMHLGAINKFNGCNKSSEFCIIFYYYHLGSFFSTEEDTDWDGSEQQRTLGRRRSSTWEFKMRRNSVKEKERVS